MPYCHNTSVFPVKGFSASNFSCSSRYCVFFTRHCFLYFATKSDAVSSPSSSGNGLAAFFLPPDITTSNVEVNTCGKDKYLNTYIYIYIYIYMVCEYNNIIYIYNSFIFTDHIYIYIYIYIYLFIYSFFFMCVLCLSCVFGSSPGFEDLSPGFEDLSPGPGPPVLSSSWSDSSNKSPMPKFSVRNPVRGQVYS